MIDRRQQLVPLAFLVAPSILLSRALGPYKAPGLPTEMLFAQLYAGAQVRRWFTDGGWFRSDVALGAGGWWPDNALAAAWQAAVGAWTDDGIALGMLLFVALFLCGFGPWRLALALGGEQAPVGRALVAGLLVQLSPAVLRPSWSGEFGVLGVGLAAMALATGSRGWALAAGAWSLPAAATVAVAGLAMRRPRLLVGLVPVGLALLSPVSSVPGAARQAIPSPRTVQGYLAENLAVFPLPPSEAPAEPWADPQVDVARAPGGAGAWCAVLAGLAFTGRGWAAAGLAAGAGTIAAFGTLPATGEPPPVPHEWVVAAGPWVPGLRAPVGTLAWSIPLLLCAAAAAARVRWNGLLLLPAAWALRVENPLMTVPATNIPPDPALSTLRGLPPGPVAVFPSPASPWRQGGRSPAELLYYATRHGHPVPVGESTGDAALVAMLSYLADEPVDQAAAPIVWSGRDQEPFAAVRAAGFTALLVDRRAIDDRAWARVDGAIASRVGTPIGSGDDWAVYALEEIGREGSE